MNFNNESDKPWILSQTDIIRHIANHPDSVKDLLNLETPVQDMIQKQNLVIVKENEIAIQVYRHMAEKNLNGVPVVNR